MVAFYKPSGRFNPLAIIFIPVVTAVVSIILALPYSLAVWYCPIIYICALLPLAWGLVTLAVSGWTISVFKVRNTALAGFLVLVGALFGYASSWVFWADLIVNSGDVISLGSGRRAASVVKSMVDFNDLWELVQNPSFIWELAKEVNEVGRWLVFKQEVKGVLLSAVWVVEALMFLGTSVYYSRVKSGRPFSEETGRFLSSRKLSKKVAVSQVATDVAERIASGDISYLLTAEPEPDTKLNSYYELIVYGGTDYMEPAYISVKLYSFKKKNNFDTKELLTYLSLPREEFETLVKRFGE